jgi:hypothetical protein
MIDPSYHRRLAAGLVPLDQSHAEVYWEACARKVIDHSSKSRLADDGGAQLLRALGGAWREHAQAAVASGQWEFEPFRADFEYKDKLQTSSSLLDRMIIQYILGQAGFRIQAEQINSLCDDELMPIPPAYRFRPPLMGTMYSHWAEDYQMWNRLPRLYALRGYRFQLRTDIRNCFYHIPRQPLLEMLQGYLRPEELTLLARRLDGPVRHGNALYPFPFGLPVGEPCSHLLANLYLAQFDRWVIQELKVPHGRYVDDMHFFFHTEEEAVEALSRISEQLMVQFGLMINPDKSEICELPAVPPDPSEVDLLLTTLKAQSEEPLELRRKRYEPVSLEYVRAKWDAITAELIEGGDLTFDFRTELDELARLRPADVDAGDNFFILTQRCLESCCAPVVPPSAKRSATVYMLMKHMVRTDRDQALIFLEASLAHEDGDVRRRAFQWIVYSGGEKAQWLAERVMLEVLLRDDLEEVRWHLQIFLKHLGLTTFARNVGMKSAHAAIRERVSSPGRCEHAVSEQVLIGNLAHEFPAIRRNTAVQVVLQQVSPRVRNACMAALAREEDREADWLYCWPFASVGVRKTLLTGRIIASLQTNSNPAF